jgi:hypothetical protein
MAVNEHWEPYRVITDYEALIEACSDRAEDLDISRITIDEAGGFTSGYAAKLLCNPPMKTMGHGSLGKMLKALGLVLVAVVDDERFEETKSQLVKRRRRAQPANAGTKRPAWLFTKKKAREMGKKRFSIMTPAELKRHQRKAGKASARARRIRQREMEAAA